MSRMAERRSFSLFGLRILTCSVMEPVDTKTVSNKRVSAENWIWAFPEVIKEFFRHATSMISIDNNRSSGFFIGFKDTPFKTNADTPLLPGLRELLQYRILLCQDLFDCIC